MKRLLLLASAVLMVTSLSAAPVPVPNFSAALSEIVTNLSAFIRVDTVNPPGNETRGAQFLKTILEREGIPGEIFTLEKDRGSLVARLKGNGKKKPLQIGRAHV